MSDAPAWYRDSEDPEAPASSSKWDSGLATVLEDEDHADSPAPAESPPKPRVTAVPIPNRPPPSVSAVAVSAIAADGPAPVLSPDSEALPGRMARLATWARSHAKHIAVACVALVLVTYVVIEFAGRGMIERATESQIRDAGVAGEVHVQIGRAWWTPSVTKLLITGRLDSASVDLRAARFFMVPVHRASYKLDDLDISLSLRHQTIRVTSLGSGSVLVAVDPSSISSFLGVPVAARSGNLFLGDSRDPAKVEVEGTNLVVTSKDLLEVNGTDQASFPVVDSYLMPCEPRAKVRGEFIELKCTGSELPGVLRQTIGVLGEQRGDPSIPAEIAPPESTVLDPEPPATGSTDTTSSDVAPTDSVPSDSAPSDSVPSGD